MKNYLAGMWNLISVESRVDGNWIPERVLGGKCVYTASGQFVLFLKTDGLSFGMTGHYEFLANEVMTSIQAATFDILDGTRWTRKIEVETDNRYSVITLDPATGTEIRNTWERVLETNRTHFNSASTFSKSISGVES